MKILLLAYISKIEVMCQLNELFKISVIPCQRSCVLRDVLTNKTSLHLWEDNSSNYKILLDFDLFIAIIGELFGIVWYIDNCAIY